MRAASFVFTCLSQSTCAVYLGGRHRSFGKNGVSPYRKMPRNSQIRQSPEAVKEIKGQGREVIQVEVPGEEQ